MFGDGRSLSVELDVRDLGGHLDFTRRAGASTWSRRVKAVTRGGCCGWCVALGGSGKAGACSVFCRLGCMLQRRRMFLLLLFVHFALLLFGRSGPVM